MRSDPRHSPPRVALREGEEQVTRKVQFRLITPMFGGGVDPMNHDPVTIIRPASIRGQLRFWWRACRGGAFGTIKDLRESEFNIWGGPSREGKVSLAVGLSGDRGKPVRAYEVVPSQGSSGLRWRVRPDSWRVPDYAGFPLQPDRQELMKPTAPRAPEVVLGVDGLLQLHYPEELADEVSASLWAWGRFGGVGGRTRRGFGAVQTDQLKSREELKRDLDDGFERYVKSGGRSELQAPLLVGARFEISPLFRNAKEAWWGGISALQEFRQAREGSPTPRSPGRSLWPEPDVIRVLSGRNSPGHEPRHPLKDAKAFPRAQFGLPIVFHFKDAKRGDPEDHTLKGAKSERLSSRLIIRPIELKEGAVLLGVILNAPALPPGGVTLVPKDPPVSQGFEVSGDGVHIDDLTEADVLGSILNRIRELRSRPQRSGRGKGIKGGHSSGGRHLSKAADPSETASYGNSTGDARFDRATAVWHLGKVRLEGEFGQVDVGINPAVFSPDDWKGGVTKVTFQTKRTVRVHFVEGQVRSVKPAPAHEGEEGS